MPRQDFAADYDSITSSWTGPIGPDGEIITIQGTLEEVISQAKALEHPGAAAVVIKREELHTRSGLAVAKKDCWPDIGPDKPPYKTRAPALEVKDAIDELAAKPGSLKLEEEGCQRVACSGERGAVFVCWEPVDDGPEVYEKPWSTVAEYARGVTEEWCKPYDHQNTQVMVVGGKVWDPQGMGVYVKSDEC